MSKTNIVLLDTFNVLLSIFREKKSCLKTSRSFSKALRRHINWFKKFNNTRIIFVVTDNLKFITVLSMFTLELSKILVKCKFGIAFTEVRYLDVRIRSIDDVTLLCLASQYSQKANLQIYTRDKFRREMNNTENNGIILSIRFLYGKLQIADDYVVDNEDFINIPEEMFYSY